MNKQNNTYTIIYAVGLVLVVGLALSAVYQALKPRQEENIADDTKSQILKAALITPQDGESISDLYASHITKSYIVNYDGAVVDSNPQEAFQATLNMDQEIKQPENKRKLPVFECTTESGLKYIIPVYGAGLWGPIWGYIAFNSDGSTIYGAYFAHQSETPGLGAEIEKPFFSEQFQNKHMFNHGKFESLQIVKKGKEPADKEYVHSVSGATITSHGVQEMLQKSLLPYEQFLKTLMRSSAAQ